MPTPSLVCTGISKSFERFLIPMQALQDRIIGKRAQRQHWKIQAVDDVSLAVRGGEWVGFFGPNGCGKTTLLRIIAGLMPQDCGTVHFGGSISCFFGLGMGFHPNLTATENILRHGLLSGLTRSEIEEATDKIIAFAGIRSHLQLPIKCYSTGMHTRLGFATAAYRDADLYLFDEIFAVGDTEFKEKCHAFLHSLKARGKSAIMVSHSANDFLGHCDRVMIMEQGRILSSCVPSAFRSP